MDFIYRCKNGEIITEINTIQLTPLENKVFNILLKNKGFCISVDEMLNEIDDGIYTSEVSIRRCICSINEKLVGILKVENKRGFGYKIKEINNKIGGKQMNKQQIIEELTKALNALGNVDFMSRERSIQNANQPKVHKAYNIIDNVIKTLKEEED